MMGFNSDRTEASTLYTDSSRVTLLGAVIPEAGKLQTEKAPICNSDYAIPFTPTLHYSYPTS